MKTRPVLDAPALAMLAPLINERAGLTFSAHFHETAEAGIRRAMKRAGTDSIVTFRQLLQTDQGIFDDLMAELTIGETYFFREPAQLDFIRHRVLPDIVERRGSQHLIRAWSAGCASGEEAYTLAIIAHEARLAAHMQILATDISQPALQRAREGSYRAWSLRDIGHTTGARAYLKAVGMQFKVNAELKKLVHFRHLNLALDVYPSYLTGTVDLDLILCRNVLIYLDAQTTSAIMQRFHDCLAPGGWLILASGDPMPSQSSLFSTHVTEAGVVYRRPFSGPSTPIQVSPPRALGNVVAMHPAMATAGSVVAMHPAVATAASSTFSATAPLSKATSTVLLTQAAVAFAAGDYATAAATTEACEGDLQAALIHVRALANLDSRRALAAAERLLTKHLLAVELHFLKALVHIELAQEDAAVKTLRQVLFLDDELALGHFLLAQLLKGQGDKAGALRSFRNAHSLCATRPATELLRFADGETCGSLAAAASGEIAHLV